MEAGILHITVVKGRKNGETLVCKPGSKFRIGRVIKGNDFAMRDPGISEKHLSFHIDPESSRWVVSDLGSSNGTILNGSKIKAWVPVPISDSDVIKIGEISELGLKIVPSNSGFDLVHKTAHKQKIEEPDQSIGMTLRRNPRRGNSSSALKEVGMNRDVSVGIEEKGVRVKRKEMKGKKTGISDDEMRSRIDKLLLETGNDNDDSDNVEKGDGNIRLKKGLEVNCEVGDHFEKLTLDQWFDSMELFLPKVIHDESEKIINILKEKARKFEEFIEAGGVRG